MDDISPPDLGGLPSWYPEIFPAGPCDGFFHKLGQHSVVCIERSPTHLVVTFDNLAEAGNPSYERELWAGKFCKDAGYSHLGVLSQGPTWFRDIRLIEFMESLRDQGFFAKFESVTFAGTSMGGFGALSFADLAPGCTVLAFSPQTTLDQTLVPWETRFQKGIAQDWTLPRSDADLTITGAAKIFVVYDPFLAQDRMHVERLSSDALVLLKGPGLGHKSAVVMRRMEQLKPIMAEAIEGTLTTTRFSKMIEGRKSIYLYRKNMEAYLEQRGRPELALRVRAAFRKRRRAEVAAAPPQASADPDPAVQNRPAGGAPAAAVVSQDWTRESSAAQGVAPELTACEPGNVWMLRSYDDGVLRYLSDRWAQRTFGFEERAGVTQVQAGQIARGIVSIGHGVAVERQFLKSYDWHVLDHTISRHTIRKAPQAVAELMLHHLDQQGQALPWVVALAVSQPGIVQDDVAPDSALLMQLDADIATAVARCANWGKDLFVDRIGLRLLAGAPGTPEQDAHAHYAAVGRDVQGRVTQLTGQTSHPVLVVSQSSGSQRDGTSEVILAEGRLEIENPLSGFVVATPTYPYPLMPDVPATPTPEAAAIVDALEVLAVEAIHQGKPWHCPALQHAYGVETKITVEFSAMSDLILVPGLPHGFAVNGDDAQITDVQVEGKLVTLTLDRPLSDQDAYLTYAFGATGEMGTGIAANQGGLRDSFEAQAPWNPDIQLFRHALSGRTLIYRH